MLATIFSVGVGNTFCALRGADGIDSTTAVGFVTFAMDALGGMVSRSFSAGARGVGVPVFGVETTA